MGIRPFCFDGRLDRPLVVVFTLINSLVLLNALLHNPFVGYDALDHLRYIDALSRGGLPGPDDSGEFFAAPLPYALPALLYAVGTDRWGVVIKAAQLLNVVWSLGLTIALVRVCRLVRPDDRRFALWTLILLGTLPVYYKTFAFVRGEPLEAFLAVVAMERSLSILAAQGTRRGQWFGLGVTLGLLMLAKQWGAFVVAAIVLFSAWCAVVHAGRRQRFILGAGAALLVGGIISGGFYLSLYQRFGSVAAFYEHPSPRWSLLNRPPEFYLDPGLSKLFTEPVRESFALGENTSLWPVFYSDVWGDYWCYWMVHARDPEDGSWASGARLMEVAALDPMASNRAVMAPYLGRVNVAAAIPTAVAVAGLLIGLTCVWRLCARRQTSDREAAGLGLAAAVCVASAVGYVVLLVGYPALDVKASYMLHVFPCAALLGAAAIGRVGQASPRAHRALQGLLLLIALHNAPVFVTRFVWW